VPRVRPDARGRAGVFLAHPLIAQAVPTEGRIPGTGHLQRIVFNEHMQEMRRESMLREFRQRIREVREGPDGLLYLLTDEDDGALLRLEPAP
jgi:hypothetical protein